ncbi:EF-P lysine aminoacylase GenX [Thiorhodococcus mannitoliphagus]|uniref:EF-P lysine aminoacylase GenX n=1 Tax=Thiorhodococcus mannitoliphagus TaxID=329406 RepID=A0A6P1E1D5_9GAMM|nr:EF-P lysine aminoacylase EpmA [Thiorhodococcus mannitoliphagus]NEX22866.1 EF-P lysine aminoacylase GenX [Thiorhodococcus mannitoliphagus]
MPDFDPSQLPLSRQFPSSGQDWFPSAQPEILKARAAMLGRLRRFFDTAGVLEVDTPILSQAAVSDPVLSSLSTQVSQLGFRGGCPLYMQTSPELPMKRLLAAGYGSIYQICKVFRDDERGRFHHPEFSLLEWYRVGWDHLRLMDEVAEVVRAALDQPGMSVERVSYRDLFLDGLGVDPWQVGTTELAEVALRAGIPDAATLELDQDGWLDLLLTQRLESRLGQAGMTFIYDYPPTQAALARIRGGERPVAERFELYVQGVELANGFHELGDPLEQRQRFQADLERRGELGAAQPPLDERFLAALASGLPDCAGVALGIDRLLMIATGADHIDAVLAFPVERA